MQSYHDYSLVSTIALRMLRLRVRYEHDEHNDTLTGVHIITRENLAPAMDLVLRPAAHLHNVHLRPQKRRRRVSIQTQRCKLSQAQELSLLLQPNRRDFIPSFKTTMSCPPAMTTILERTA